MIRYPISDPELRAEINRQKRGWLAKAEKRTAKFAAAGKYDEKSGIWSEIKPVYVRLQYNKCGFCERKLSDETHGLIEHDVEHFRPKSTVSAWPPTALKSRFNYSFSTGDAWVPGYYMLAYHPWNYLAACKPCNSALKSSYFPVAGRRAASAAAATDPWTLGTEEPLLIYPLGQLDEDPAELITFYGNMPRPAHRSGPRNRRARVTIDFFELHTREDLLEERAMWIMGLWTALRLVQTGTAQDRTVAEAHIRRYLSPRAPHSNCVRAFHGLAQRSKAEAASIAEQLNQYLSTKIHNDP